MIQVIVFYSVTPGFETRFTTLFASIRNTVLEEEGCIQYELFVSPFNPLRFCLVEKWASQAALDAHLASAHMAEFLPQSRACLSEKATIEMKEIASEKML